MNIRAILSLLLVFLILLPALAQTKTAVPPLPQKQDDEKDDVVKITTNLVQVDLVVTKDGRHVTDLTADDFEIYEDGRKQQITSFSYISNLPPDRTASASTAESETDRNKSRELVPSTPLSRNAPRRTIAVVVDDLGLSAESLSQVRRQLRKFVAEEIQPNDLVAIIRTGGEVGALQQFTNDPRILSRAVEQLRWNYCSRVGINLFAAKTDVRLEGAGAQAGTPPICSHQSYKNTTDALSFIVEAMGDLPGRKSMILLSDSLPTENQEPGDSASEAASFESATDFNNALQKVAEKAIRSSVVIYAVDTQGLPTLGVTAADTFRGTARDITNQINSTLSARSSIFRGRREGGRMIAEQTGGFQVRNSNSFQLDRILEDQSGYYLLGYRPADETFNRRFHHIKAKVKRSGVTLRTRYGFYGVSEEELNKSKRSAGDLTNLALISPFAAQDINVDITSFFAGDRSSGSVIRNIVYLDPNDMSLVSGADGLQLSFDLHAVIFGDNGAVVDQLKRGVTLNLSEPDYEQARNNGMQLTLDLPIKKPGAYQVRIAARDRVSSRIGSAKKFVVVPNLANHKPAVSGIVLGTGTDSTGKVLSNIGARKFGPNSSVYFAYMLYNMANEGGKPRNLIMQKRLYRDGKRIYAGPEAPINAANQVDPSQMFVNDALRLPVGLEPGFYYLEIVVTEQGGKNKSLRLVQWADFEIENEPQPKSEGK